MADELKHLYKEIEASDAEMAQFRRNLGATLQQTRPRFYDAFAWWQLLLVPAFALLLVIGLPRERPQWTNTESLDALLESVQRSSQTAIRKQAQTMLTQGDGIAAANARALLVMTSEQETIAIDLASEGLNREPRAEFRQFYLEWLLDRWDKHQWNKSRYEALMEQEDDPICLALFQTFLET